MRNNRATSLHFSTKNKEKSVPLWCKNVQKTARTFERSDTLGVKRMMSCRSHDGRPAVLHLCCFFNKGFSLRPPSLSPSLPSSRLLAWGAARGPPDAYRQMSLVEQNTLCLTSQAATGLWRKLRGSLPCKDHSIKGRPGFWVGLSLPLPRESSGPTAHSRKPLSI